MIKLRNLHYIAGLLALWCSASAAADFNKAGGLYRFAATPAWVEPVQVQYEAQNPPGNLSDGAWFLMVDRQIDVTSRGDDYYEHIAIRVINPAGIKSQSQLDFSVDPSYQTLLIHSLKVVRNGQVLDQQSRARITALPQETELAEHIYNGGYNVNVVLSDVRVGDVIEYDYTVRSHENVFPGHFAARMSAGWSDPVHWQRIRLRYPADRALRYRFTSAPVAPERRREGDHQELVFQWHDVPGTTSEDESPSWYRQWPMLEISDLDGWPGVARLAAPLYRLSERPRPRLDAAIAAIRSEGGTPEEKTLHALQFVQENIRYTSISIGPGSFTPTDPEIILERRFGDCKDKSLLLATMLRRLGIDAEPALVHSRRGQILPDELPTPYAFNHAIVRAQIGPAVYWLDGTSYKQYSPLQQLETGDFAYALPIDESTSGLEQVRRPKADASGRHVQMTIDLRKGLFVPATLDVVTRYYGDAADTMRNTLSRGGSTQRESNYLNYYARLYSGVKTLKPLEVKDDTAHNALETREHYSIEKTFEKGGDDKETFSIDADEMYRYGDPLKHSVRTTPLAIDYPDHVRQTITVLMPDPWPVKNESVMIDDPAFSYRSKITHKDNNVTLDYEYTALADHVNVDVLPQYVTDRARINNGLGYRFKQDANAATAAESKPLAVAPAPFFAAFFSVCLGAWLMLRRVYRYDPPPRTAPAGAPAGIGGWLLLPALGVLLTPLTMLVLLGEYGRFIDADMWQALPQTVAEPYRDWARPVLLALLGSEGLLLPFSVTVLILFLRKRSSTPMLYLILLWIAHIHGSLVVVSAAVSGLDTAKTLPQHLGEIVRDTIVAAVWTAYMLNSQRVKATFTRRLRPQPPPLPAEAATAH